MNGWIVTRAWAYDPETGTLSASIEDEDSGQTAVISTAVESGTDGELYFGDPMVRTGCHLPPGILTWILRARPRSLEIP